MSELHAAAAAGDTDLVEQLLQTGACDPSMKDPDWGERTPLHWAAAKGKADMVKLLITSGSRPCLRTTTGWTPAHFAAESGRLSVLKMLHSLHAPVDKADMYGDTPRRMAEIYGQGDCVKFLEVAEQESSNYRRAAEMNGILLDDTDEEWESQKESKTAGKRETVSKSIITCKLQQRKKSPYTAQVNKMPQKGKLSKLNKVCKKEIQVEYRLSEIPKSKTLSADMMFQMKNSTRHVEGS